ncbi:hypothetical protein PG993_009720 [Apiospora rasikravindrae]|uniref:Uncharacterized protein n=1 Tax=Apiospora rasikravindrae TaxID=990691 RepID=A0ABR1SK75_9PEZI
MYYVLNRRCTEGFDYVARLSVGSKDGLTDAPFRRICVCQFPGPVSMGRCQLSTGTSVAR